MLVCSIGKGRNKILGFQSEMKTGSRKVSTAGDMTGWLCCVWCRMMFGFSRNKMVTRSEEVSRGTRKEQNG